VPGTESPTALITGASGGLGSAIAAALAPTHELLLAGRPSKRLDEVLARLDPGGRSEATRGTKRNATPVPLDLTDVGSDVAADIDRLDVLVHNAGVAYPDHLAESRIEDWRTTFEVNVIGVVALTRALLPALRRAKGQVIFINSGAGLNVLAGMASYSASKFALRAYADSLRAEEPKLHVTSVHVGRIDTAMQRKLVEFEGGKYDARHYLKPETVAAVIANVVATPPDGRVHQIVLRPN
jgi:NADP-dependent 3-hydroxy acid dehydrogenase YdfG